MHRFARIRLRKDHRAATAIEFALVCAPFTIFLLSIMGAGLHYYVQQALEYATQAAVRQVQLGQIAPNYTEADFVNKVLCPAFGQFQSCTNLYVDLRPVTDYEQVTNSPTDAPNSTSTTGFVFCPGTPGQLMYAHVIYLLPSIAGTLLGNTAGGGAIIANAAFANENPTGVAVVQANGC
ncbi:TadE/TadG family type IV pilus assembly protein [Rhodopila sp.]|uniref:TadE/TadG family type IV pilus assembly protein n=1 Tax=Rhodopila sp. TaxID=2480087 RepID=UPI003D0DDE7F